MGCLINLLRSFACVLLAAIALFAGFADAVTLLPLDISPGNALAGDRDDDDRGSGRASKPGIERSPLIRTA